MPPISLIRPIKMPTFLNKYKEKILKVLVYTAAFTSLLYPYTDKDWGWHFRYGQYFFTHGQLLTKDIYSWTMTGYPWINHEWSFDPILYFLFNNGGYLGLSIAGALVTLLCFWLLTKSYKLNFWQLGIAAFFFVQLTETAVNEGLRGQVLAFVPLALLMYLIEKSRENLKTLYFLPLLFLIWTNMHGTVVFGVAILGAFFLWRFIKDAKHRKLYILIGFVSVLATAFNPFGIGIYHEALKHTANPYLHNIIEWLPITSNCPDCHVPTFSIYVLILALALFVRKESEDIPYIIVILALLWETIGARRYLPLFAITTLPLFAKYLSGHSPNLAKYKILPFLTAILAFVAIEFNLFNRLPAYNFYNYSEHDYCKFSSLCSPEFADFIKANPPFGDGFNFYDWGGYLIGKGFPGKLFIDGRMHLWVSDEGYQPFGDMVEMYYNGNNKLFDSYNFNWVLVPPDSQMAKNIALTGLGTWQVRYRDRYTVYFVRIK